MYDLCASLTTADPMTDAASLNEYRTRQLADWVRAMARLTPTGNP